MITPPSPFRYFRDPHHFSSYSETGEACPFCELVRPGYGGGLPEAAKYLDHAEYHGFVCEVCLGNGKLVENGLLLQEGEEIRLDIRLRHPGLSGAEVEVLAQQRTTGLQQCTPRIKGWWPFEWLSHCGDFCRFIKESGQLDMHRLAPDGDGHAFLESLLDDDIWDMIRPDAPEDSLVEHHVGLYLFQCLECGKYRVGYRLGVW